MVKTQAEACQESQEGSLTSLLQFFKEFDDLLELRLHFLLSNLKLKNGQELKQTRPLTFTVYCASILQMEKQPRIQREGSAGSRTVISSQHPSLTALRIATVADLHTVERSLDASYQGH